MPQLKLAGEVYEVNEDGFLQETGRWTESVARAYAAMEGTPELTESHWKVIHYLRGYYLEKGICPMIKRLLRDTGLKLYQLYELFPDGPAGGAACRWAGVPNSAGCH